MLQPSETIKTFIKGYEQFRDKAYLPTKDDKWTIAWGHTAGVTPGMTCTRAQGDAWFVEDITGFAQGVWGLVGGVPTTQGQFDAMVSLAYNIGLTNFLTSSVLTCHRAGHYATAAMAFALWNKQRDKATGELVVVNGLTKRRKDEAAIYAKRS